MEEETESLDLEAELESLDLATINSYDVMAMVVCTVISAAILMCYLTWRFRYKIVLRTVGRLVLLGVLLDNTSVARGVAR